MRSLNKKIKSLFLLISFAAYMPISIAPSFAAVGANTTPVLDSSINGGKVGVNGTIDVNGQNKTNFEVNVKDGLGKGGTALYNWGTFDVGSNVAVNWRANASGQRFINIVKNTGKASEIYGALTSSCAITGCDNYAGKAGVILINPNGITFGNGSIVNLGSFTASTRHIRGLDELQEKLFDEATVNGVRPQHIASAELTSKFGGLNPIVFDKSIVDSQGNGVISLNGAQFNKDGTIATSVALIGDKIDINNSTIQTYEGTKGNFNNGYARSNVKLITADGVSFTYDANWNNITEANADGSSSVLIDGGYDKDGNRLGSSKISAGTTADQYGISINNSNIYSGSVQAENRYENADVNINKSFIWGSKLWNASSGEVLVAGDGNINITNSRIETGNIYNANDDAKNPEQASNFGGIKINAKNNVTIDNSRIASAPSALNVGLPAGTPGKAANIKIKADNGNVTIKKSQEAINAGYNQQGTTDIVSYGDLRLEADYGEVKTEFNNINTQLNAYNNLFIGGKNVNLTGGSYGSQKGDVLITAGSLVKNDTTGYMDILGGGIKINNAAIQAAKGELGIEGLETTIANTALDYKTLSLYNDYFLANNLNHDVLIKDGTTFYDRMVENGDKDTLVIETTGQLIFDHNKIQKAEYDNGTGYTPTVTNKGNQTSNVKLSSLSSQVSIRNNSEVNVGGNLEMVGKTNANVTTSDVTANSIKMTGRTKVTVGNAVDQIDGDTNVIAKRGSNLIARNGNIELTAIGDTKDPLATSDIRGITILHSNLEAQNNILTANNGDVSVQTSNITATNNNTLTADNGRVGIQNHIEKDGTVCAGSNVVAQNGESNIQANGDVIITKSKVESKNNNKITSNTGKVYAQGTGALVKSTEGDITINQYLTSNTDNDFDQAQGINAVVGNVTLKVNGANQDIITNGTIGSFSTGKRLTLDANRNIDISKQGDLNVRRVDLIAGNNVNVDATGTVTINDSTFDSNKNNVTAGNNVDIRNNMTIKKGETTIKAKNNVKTNATNGLIETKGNKLIVNAEKEIDIAFTGVDQKNAGLQINTDVNTSNDQVSASGRKETLAGRKVTLNAKDGNLSIAKIKADELTIVNPNSTNFIAATNNGPDASVDNIGPNANTATVGSAYIEVQKLAGWNMDTNVADFENIPSFYVDGQHYDLASDGNTQRHWLQFGDNQNILLVYQRKTSEVCEPDVPVTPGVKTRVYDAQRETSVVRLPRHEEGVSAVAPVLNEITDPTANVIMAAARITLDDENETDEEGNAIQ